MVSYTDRVLPTDYDALAPDGSEIRLLGQFPQGGMCHCRLPAGGVTQAVEHLTVVEIWYCLTGRGEVWRMQDQSESILTVTPGIALTIPLGTRFQFRTVGQGPLEFVIATIPSWPGPEEAVPCSGVWEPNFQSEIRA